MGTLSKVPRGLLALLGIQNMGDAPRELAAVVAPNLDLTKLYLLNEMVQQTAVANPPAGAFNCSIPVPAGECWHIHVIDALAVNPAGATVTIAPGVRMNGVSVSLAPTLAVAASQTRRTSSGALGLWLPSGAELGCITSEITGAPIAAIQVLYSAYRA